MVEAAEIDLDQNDEDHPKEKVLSAADQLTLKEYEESLFEDDDEDEVIGDLDFEVQGPLGQLYREILDSATYPNKAIAFAGALVGFSGLIERKWSTPLDGRANLEIVCLANSGSGKDHPRKFISAISRFRNPGTYLWCCRIERRARRFFQHFKPSRGSVACG
jgi:hypothetical protein